MEAYIAQRVRDIVECNPWLLGSLIKKSTGLDLTYSIGNISLEYEKRQTFSITNDSQLDETSDYETISSRMKRLAMNIKVINKKDIPYCVVLIRMSSQKFAILFSLNHIIGDGQTSYQLYGMLNEKSKPRSLIAERISGFTKAKDDIMGKENSFNASAFLGFIIKVILKSVFCTMHKVEIHSVDQVAIEKLKLEHKQSTDHQESFISTDDILQSWLLCQMRCDIGFVSLNFRNRIPGVTADHAGNYSDSFKLQKHDFDSPFKIRESIKSHPRIEIPLPDSSMKAAQKKYSFMSSWVSDYEDVQLSDCNQIYHVPFVEPQSALSSSVIYRPRKGEIRVLTMSKLKMFSKPMVIPSIKN